MELLVKLQEANKALAQQGLQDMKSSLIDLIPSLYSLFSIGKWLRAQVWS